MGSSSSMSPNPRGYRILFIAAIAGLLLLTLVVFLLPERGNQLRDNSPKGGGDSGQMAAPSPRRHHPELGRRSPGVRSDDKTDDPGETTTAVTVVDDITGKPLKGVLLALEMSDAPTGEKNLSVPSDGQGRISIPSSLLSLLPRNVAVRLPDAMGGIRLNGRLSRGENDAKLIVPAFARIMATVRRDDGSAAMERPMKGKLWLATWPTPEQALGTENPAIQSSGLRAWYEMRALHSETTSWRINVDYHSRLAEQPGVDESQIQVVGVDFVQDKDMVVDLAYAGEVVADLFLPGLGVQKRTAQIQRGMVTSIVFDPPKKRTLLVVVTDPEGRPIPGAEVTVVVRREVLAGELVPATAFSVFTPNGTEKRLAFGKSIVQTSASGEASVGLGFLGVVFVSANKEGFIPHGRIVLTGRTPPTSKPVRLSLRPIPPETPKVTFRVKGVPVGKLKFVLADLQPQDQFFELPLGSHETDDKGRANLGMLSPGRLYGVSMRVNDEDLARGFVYEPGMVIDMDDKSGMTTVNPGRK